MLGGLSTERVKTDRKDYEDVVVFSHPASPAGEHHHVRTTLRRVERAGILVRISDDRSGSGRGVERQEQDCRDLAERRGWEVVKVYRENDTSAFSRRKVRLPDGTTALRVVRPAFRELLEDLTAGTITALVAYDLDRVARDPRDLEDLIDAVETRGAPTAVVTGDVDLSSDNGVTMARFAVTIGNKASRDTSRRVRRAMQSHAAKGGVGGGGRPFGYLPGGLLVDRTEAAAVRWAHEQITDGRSLRSVGLALAGLFPHRRWDAEMVRRVLTSPRNAGLREHLGQIVGEASWPGLVTPERRDLTMALLDSRNTPARVRGGPRKYLLTGLLVCRRCGQRLYPRRNADRQRFGCLPATSGGCGGSLILYTPCEEAVVDLVLARLRRDLDPVEVEADDPTADLRRQIADLEAQQEQLGRDLAADPSAALMLRGLNRSIGEQIDKLRARVGTVARAAFIADPAQVVEGWPDYLPDQQRTVIETLIEKVIVGPHPGGPRFAPSRLEVVWR